MEYQVEQRDGIQASTWHLLQHLDPFKYQLSSPWETWRKACFLFFQKHFGQEKDFQVESSSGTVLLENLILGFVHPFMDWGIVSSHCTRMFEDNFWETQTYGVQFGSHDKHFNRLTH